MLVRLEPRLSQQDNTLPPELRDGSTTTQKNIGKYGGGICGNHLQHQSIAGTIRLSLIYNHLDRLVNLS